MQDKDPVLHIVYRQTCRVCGSHDLIPVLDLGRQYLQGSFLKDGYPPPPLRPLPTELVRCDVTRNENGCGLIQLRHTMPPEVLYANYWYTSGTNGTMRRHLQEIVASTLAFATVQHRRVLDIGCNDGTLLGAYPADWDRIGIDPSDVATTTDPAIKIVHTLFPSPQLDALVGPGTCDIVTSIAMFYDLPDPIGFASAVKTLLSAEGVWVVEMSYLPLMLRQNSFDTICHEHLEYYSLAVLEIIMRSAGLVIFRVELNGINGGSIRCYVSRADCQAYSRREWRDELHRLRVREFELELDTDRPYAAFRHRIESLRSETIRLLKRLKSQDKTIHLYGASTKGNVLLQWYGIDRTLVEMAADRNPAKNGARTLGTNIPIVDEETSRREKPDYYLVLPWHFKREFLQREQAMLTAGTKMIFPLPRLSIVSSENLAATIEAAEREETGWLSILDDPLFVEDVLGLL